MRLKRPKVLLYGLWSSFVIAACSDFEATAPSASGPPQLPSAAVLIQANLIADPGFELGGNGWNNVASTDRSIVSDQFRSGARSVRMIVSNRYSRDVTQEVTVKPGQRYYAETWIKTNGVNNGASLRLVWLSSTGAVIATRIVGTAASTQAWRRYYTTVAAPSGSARVRYQLFMAADPDDVGAAWFDDNVFGAVSTVVTDTVAPTVAITAPTAGALLSGTAVNVDANASDNVGVAGVLFRVDGLAIAQEDTVAPYSVTLNTTQVGNGPHLVTAIARDRAGNTRVSAPVSITVYNQTVLDITYCSPGGVKLLMDVYYPPLSTPMPAPAVMFIHGGGWQGGDKTSSIGMYDVPRLTRRGYVVVSINYRIWPYVFPAYVEDAKCAVRHLRAKASFYRIDPARVGLWGHSAGGHIAAMVATTNAGVYEGNGGYPGINSRVRAVATYAAPFDVTVTADFPTMGTELDRLFGTNKTAPSPINHVTADDPPFLIVHGTADKSINIRQAQNMYSRLRAAGVSAQMLTVTNGSHTLVGTTASPDRRAISDSLALFFDRRVK